MTGAKIRDSKRYVAGQGQTVGAVPSGYRWEDDGTDRLLVIDEAVAPIIRRIFDEYATGTYSTRDIARRLNAEGLVPPRFKGGWRQDTVAQILGNEAYIGVTYVNRRYREGQAIEAQWPVLIERDTWDRVQRLLGRYDRRSSAARLIIHGWPPLIARRGARTKSRPGDAPSGTNYRSNSSFQPTQRRGKPGKSGTGGDAMTACHLQIENLPCLHIEGADLLVE
jgi:Recombinase